MKTRHRRSSLPLIFFVFFFLCTQFPRGNQNENDKSPTSSEQSPPGGAAAESEKLSEFRAKKEDS